MELGEYLKQLRKEKGLSLREAAKRSGVSHPYLSQLENGRNDKPSVEVLKKLAEIYDYPQELLEAAGLVSYIQIESEQELNAIIQEEYELRNKKDVFYQLQNNDRVYINGEQINKNDREKLANVIKAIFPEHFNH